MNYLNKFGFILLILFSSIIPFHFYSENFGIFYLYREMMAAIFLLLLLINLYGAGPIPIRPRKEVFYLMLFPFLLLLSAIYDPMELLYKEQYYMGGGSVSDISQINVDPRIYILRNAVIYLPMTFYIAVRGLSEKEISQIALFSVLVAPFSVLGYLLDLLESGTFSIFLLGEMTEKGRGLIAYNSYVPYLSFPVISGMYLLSSKNSLATKIMVLASISIVSIFIFLSSSRQTILFIVIGIVTFVLVGSSKANLKRVFMFSLSALAIYLSFLYIMADYKLDEALLEKYQYGENSRFAVIFDGILRLEFYQYLIGAGLSSVIDSGPHNDYVRWTQRVGIFFMIIAFIPYYMIGFKCLGRVLKNRNDLLSLYFGFGVAFVIYHSVFGYPREDAFQAIWCYLGIAMSLGYSTYLKQRELLNKNI
ncbi:hypothetical protein OAP06_04520 [Gammaproteobacteria bacterium]|nr:hypothetical protein [Gammaproteobacteria bacterium]